MSLFRKTVSIRCSGDKNSQCPSCINNTPLPAHKRHCPDPNCGSSVIEDTVPNVPAIAVLMGLLVVSGGSIGYLFWQRLPNIPTTKTSSTTSIIPTPTQTPTPTNSAVSTPNSTPKPQSTETPTSQISPSVTPTPTPGGEEVVVLPLPPPSVDEIQNAIIKLEAMGTNKILEFPIKGKPNYMMVGFSDSNTNLGLTTKTVRIILQESLKNNGKFPEGSQITPILKNKDTKERSFDDKISQNEFLSRIVRTINNTKTIQN